MKTSSFLRISALVVLLELIQLPTRSQPVTDTGVDITFDFDSDGERDATYEHQGFNFRPGAEPYYNVNFYLRNTTHCRFVRVSKQRIDFATGNAVSPAAQVYVGPGEGNEVTLLAYDAESRFGQWTFFNTVEGHPDAFFLGKTEVLVGFRLTSLEAGTKHHGWIRFTRPDSHFTTPFTVAGYDWNPLPNEPIGAGQPPVIPVQSAFTSEGQLRLQWPTEVANWMLESSLTLGPDAVWEPVPDVVGTEHLLAPPETDRFYRLIRP